MVTTVGTEATIEKLVENLMALERDAIAAYEAAIERIDDADAKQNISEFCDDHLQHVRTLETMSGELGIKPPETTDAKSLLTTGKIMMANLMGDAAILKAMKTNEDDTVSAYEAAVAHADAKPETAEFFKKALEDEKRHRAYMETAAERL